MRRYSVRAEFRLNGGYVLCTSPLIRWSKHRPLIVRYLLNPHKNPVQIGGIHRFRPRTVAMTMGFAVATAGALAWYFEWNPLFALAIALGFVNPFTLGGFISGDAAKPTETTWQWLRDLDSAGVRYRDLRNVCSARSQLFTPYDLLVSRFLAPLCLGYMIGVAWLVVGRDSTRPFGWVPPPATFVALVATWLILQSWVIPIRHHATGPDLVYRFLRNCQMAEAGFWQLPVVELPGCRPVAGHVLMLLEAILVPVAAFGAHLLPSAHAHVCAFLLALLAALHLARARSLERMVCLDERRAWRRRARRGQLLFEKLLERQWEKTGA